jgi:hypothetical protein
MDRSEPWDEEGRDEAVYGPKSHVSIGLYGINMYTGSMVL